jgi:V/A-type H+-transporting ATPase subunit K
MEWAFLGQIGLALAFGLAAMGSSLGIIAAGKAAAGAWAKEAKAGMALRFNYIIFVGAPISQTFYAMIVMVQMAKVLEHASSSAGLMLGIGLATGISEMVSAWGQGMIGAAACRCLSEGEGKGLAFLLIAIGIIETVGIFTMVFMLMLAGSIAG